MSGRTALLVATAILLSVAAIIAGWILGQGRDDPEGTDLITEPQLRVIEGPTTESELYFPGPGGRLYAEMRELPAEEDREAHIEQILAALVEGPESEDLFPALPPEMVIDWVHFSPQAVLYVDLKHSGEQALPPWGSRQEMLAVYSIVNTVLANSPDLEAVVLLRNGQQQPTFAGHLDTSRPLLANQRLVASR